MSKYLTRIRFSITYAYGQWRSSRTQVLLAIVGIALAVLAVTLLAGAGFGVIDTGQDQFETADRDLWVSSGETSLSPVGGGFANTIDDSRNLSQSIAANDNVTQATPLSFETLYVGEEPDTDALQTVIGVGVPGGGDAVQVTDGADLPGDPHYADGTYDGEKTNQVLLDQGTADRLNVTVGDTVHAGYTTLSATANNMTVAGISPTYQELLGAGTVVMPLSEFHTETGTTGTEPATFITVSVDDEADTASVQAKLQEAYPNYEIRTDQQQLQAIVEDQVLVFAAGGSTVVLAFIGGTALTFTLLSVIIYQQRRPLAALQAQGAGTGFVLSIALVQGLLLGTLGGLAGILLTAPAASVLNHLAALIVGFEGLVQTDPRIYAGGFIIAVGVGTLGALIAGVRMSRYAVIDRLEP
ncbi:ABC transporter permease [Salinarchaeum sp. IM2453]|uniref:ABC transporter permease n=1 Tax=Salinarchaeum sp. IM2453 TaxID=2862870 RepID=UPI001C8355B7|nr:ABC transporter permease [Salinarchaeum sp. IM2453]QZA89027.1 ABC transporter permease [Salinarchaeum sp. IM2453]